MSHCPGVSDSTRCIPCPCAFRDSAPPPLFLRKLAEVGALQRLGGCVAGGRTCGINSRLFASPQQPGHTGNLPQEAVERCRVSAGKSPGISGGRGLDIFYDLES